MNDNKEELYRMIRDVIAVDPHISTRSLQKFLDSKGYHFGSNHTVQKYRDKVETAIVLELDMTKMLERLATMSERLRMTFNQLQRIAFWDPNGSFAKAGMPPPAYRDQISALRTMMTLDISVFKTQRAAGVFKKVASADEEEQRRFAPLPSEAREKIITALKNWGFYPGSDKEKEEDVYYDSDIEVVRTKQEEENSELVTIGPKENKHISWKLPRSTINRR